MYYAVCNSFYRSDLIIDDNGIIVYPKCFFGKAMCMRDMWYDPEEDTYVEDEAGIELIDCSRSLKKLKKAFGPWRKQTDYGALTRMLNRKRGRYYEYLEEAVQILRERREKRTCESVCRLAHQLWLARPRQRREGS